MSEEWFWLFKRYNEVGARTEFENIYESSYKRKYPRDNPWKPLKIGVD